jgi:protocatechuate 3,4-dioxygenase beta subunit
MMTRREWGALTLAAPLAVVGRARAMHAQGLGQFVMPTVPCGDVKPTPQAPDEQTFKPRAPQRSSLVEPDMTGQKLTLTGAVAGVVCGPIKNARVDVWQADATGKYDTAGFRLRGYVVTDASGVYRIDTIVPGASSGRAPHINIKVQAAGKPTLSTQLFLPDDPRNANDKIFRPELALKTAKTSAGLAATFNLILDA